KDAKLVVSLSSPAIVSVQDESVAKTLVKADDQGVVFAFVPRSESVYRSRGKGRQEGARSGARHKRNIRFSLTQQIVHCSMIVVGLNNQVSPDLSLHADAETVGIRCGKSAVDGGRQNLCRNGGMSQRAKRSPEKETSRLSYGGARSISVLLRRQTGERLNIGNINYRVRRN